MTNYTSDGSKGQESWAVHAAAVARANLHLIAESWAVKGCQVLPIIDGEPLPIHAETATNPEPEKLKKQFAGPNVVGVAVVAGPPGPPIFEVAANDLWNVDLLALPTCHGFLVAQGDNLQIWLPADRSTVMPIGSAVRPGRAVHAPPSLNARLIDCGPIGDMVDRWRRSQAASAAVAS